MNDDDRTWQAEQMWKAALSTYDKKRAAGKSEHSSLLAALMAYSRAQQDTTIALAQRQVLAGK